MKQIIIFVLLFSFLKPVYISAETTPVSPCSVLGNVLFSRVDKSFEGQTIGTLFLAELASGKINPLVAVQDFFIEAAAADRGWKNFLFAGFSETDGHAKTAIYTFKPGMAEPILLIEKGVTKVGGLSLVFDPLENIFYVAVIDNREDRSVWEILDAISEGEYSTVKTFLYKYSVQKRKVKLVAEFDFYLELTGAVTEDYLTVRVLGNEEFAGLYDLVVYKSSWEISQREEFPEGSRNGGVGFGVPDPFFDEGCNISVTYYDKNGGRKDFIISDMVLRGPRYSRKSEALVYMFREPTIEKAKLKVLLLGDGAEKIFELPPDEGLPRRSRYNLLFVE